MARETRIVIVGVDHVGVAELEKTRGDGSVSVSTSDDTHVRGRVAVLAPDWSYEDRDHGFAQYLHGFGDRLFVRVDAAGFAVPICDFGRLIETQNDRTLTTWMHILGARYEFRLGKRR